MFKTMRDAELLLKRKTHPQARFWQYVELGNCWPWFYVVLVQEQSQNLHQSFVFAPSISSLVKLLPGSSQSYWIDKVYAATPGDLNGTMDWKMEPLAQLIEIKIAGKDLIGHHLIISDGGIYTTAPVEMTDSRHQSVVIFSEREHLGPKL